MSQNINKSDSELSSSSVTSMFNENPKNIVLCFDGTDGNFGPNPFTNILKIYKMLDNNDKFLQVCYYQPGIGTGMGADLRMTSLRKFMKFQINQFVDSMFAYTLDNHLISAYMFLMKFYTPGDKIYMFGFSRGAFIARILAGMLERVGLLSPGLDDMIPMAWKIYEAWEYAAQPSQNNYKITLVEEFKKTFCQNHKINVHFQGLFDSVNSCGILRDRLFPLTARSSIVKHVRHAVSMDERRGKFKQQSFSPNPYVPKLFSLAYRNYVVESYSNSPKSTGSIIDNEIDNNPLINTTLSRPLSTSSPDRAKNPFYRDELTSDLLTRINIFLDAASHNHIGSRYKNFVSKQRVEGIFQHYSPSTTTPIITNRSPDLVEKWFPGDHGDVGGGWGPDIDTNQFFSNIPLRWMLAEAIKHGVIFKKNSIHEFAKKYNSLGSLCAPTHDLLKFSSNYFTMPNPFTRTRNPSKKELALFYGVKKLRTHGFPYISLKNTSKVSKEKEQTSNTDIKKFDGRGNEPVATVLLWWLIELIPIGIRIENTRCEWKNIYIPNLGRNRNIPEHGELHWSIFWRIKFVKDYRPKNLPKYANDLIESYLKINLTTHTTESLTDKKTTYVLNYNPYLSYKVSTPLLANRDNLSSYCEYPSTNNSENERIAREAKALILEGVSNKWEEVPDDLLELLRIFPNL